MTWKLYLGTGYRARESGFVPRSAKIQPQFERLDDLLDIPWDVILCQNWTKSVKIDENQVARYAICQPRWFERGSKSEVQDLSMEV